VLHSYVVFLAFEVGFVWFMIPETLGRSLEELTFREYLWSSTWVLTLIFYLVFEEDELLEQNARVQRELVGTEGTDTNSEKSGYAKA